MNVQLERRPETEPLSIGDVSAATGVNPVTLRAWERRYGLIRPQRTQKGHRLYDASHLERIRSILGWLDRGVAIGRVRALIERPEHAVDEEREPVWSEALEAGLAALRELDGQRLEQLFNSLLRDYPLAAVLANWADPLHGHLRAVEEADTAALLESMLAGFLEVKLGGRLLAGNSRRRAPRFLLLPLGTARLEAVCQAALLHEQGVNASVCAGPVSPETILFSASARRVAGVLLVLAPEVTPTQLLRGIGAAPRRLDGPLLLAGPGLAMLGELPPDTRGIFGNRAEVAMLLRDWMERSS